MAKDGNQRLNIWPQAGIAAPRNCEFKIWESRRALAHLEKCPPLVFNYPFCFPFLLRAQRKQEVSAITSHMCVHLICILHDHARELRPAHTENQTTGCTFFSRAATEDQI